MTNRDLLKEAIADAKSVKETAIANAKAALEEAFTPHLKSMLSAKLEEMDKDEDVEENLELEEMDAPDFKRKNGASIDSAPRKVGQTTVQEEEEIEEELDLDEILGELNEAEEVEEAEEAEDDAAEEMEDEEIDLEDMSEDDLKSFIESVISDMVEAGELEAGEGTEDEDEMESDEEELDMEDDTEEIMEGGMDPMSMFGADTGKELDTQFVNWIKKNINNPKVKSLVNTIKSEFQAGADAAGSAMRNESEELDEMGGGSADPMSMFGADTGKELDTQFVNWIKKNINSPKVKAMMAGLKDEFQAGANAAGSAMRNEEELSEALKEINALKQELQEINLLNAKLLYSNKIFKAKNLTEGKKLKVLKAFDKAESVKEAKVIFETLNEGIESSTPKSSISENLKKGMASKSTGIIAEGRNSIIEVDPMMARWQKLAGIQKD